MGGLGAWLLTTRYAYGSMLERARMGHVRARAGTRSMRTPSCHAERIHCYASYRLLYTRLCPRGFPDENTVQMRGCRLAAGSVVRCGICLARSPTQLQLWKDSLTPQPPRLALLDTGIQVPHARCIRHIVAARLAGASLYPPSVTPTAVPGQPLRLHLFFLPSFPRSPFFASSLPSFPAALAHQTTATPRLQNPPSLPHLTQRTRTQ